MPDDTKAPGPEVKIIKPTPLEIAAAQEKVELHFLRVQNLELNAKLIETEHPKCVQAWEQAKATLATLQKLAQS